MLLATKISDTRLKCGVKIPDTGIREPQNRAQIAPKTRLPLLHRCPPKIGPSWTEPKIDIRVEDQSETTIKKAGGFVLYVGGQPQRPADQHKHAQGALQSTFFLRSNINPAFLEC